MALESLISPVIKAIFEALNRAKKHELKKSAKKALSDAIGELVKLNPDLDSAEASIAIAKAAGIIDKDLFKAEKMLSQVRKPSTGKICKVPAAKKIAISKAVRSSKKVK